MNFSLHSHQKFRSESGNNPLSDPNPSTSGQSKPSKTSSMPYSISPSNPGTFSFPVAGVPSADVAPPRSPDYGFHMLERRTIAMADGKIRFYFALPPDYQGVPVKRFLPPGTEGHGIELGNPDLGSGKSFQSGGLLISEGLGRDGNEMYGCGGQIDHCNSLKRKYGDEYERDWRDGGDEFARRRQQLLQFCSPSSKPNGVPSDSELDLDNGDEDIDGASTSVSQDSQESGREIDDLRSSKDMGFEGNYEDLSSLGFKHPDMNQEAFVKAFLRYSKLVNEDASQRKNYLEDGKHGPLYCLACGRHPILHGPEKTQWCQVLIEIDDEIRTPEDPRTSKDFPDMHGLIMHAYNSQNANLRVDHLGLHKALCVLMGWNYAKPPDNSKAYQSLSSDVAMANKDDLIMWPPLVIIRNTNTRRRIDGIMKGMKNKEVNLKIRGMIHLFIPYLTLRSLVLEYPFGK
ncbi:hypothetical protein HHK36_022757 [Tetracentron sinense]|uniref:XS domain-containing protein n=1 Tax=Tetracentron sinense TaxID=13715 RepID=A0A834YSJ3_TETSI|nr:hypothetical protein HHK36_022757 [Tetracentron sinense]